MEDFTELLVQQKSRKKPRAGDVFSLKLEESVLLWKSN